MGHVADIIIIYLFLGSSSSQLSFSEGIPEAVMIIHNLRNFRHAFQQALRHAKYNSACIIKVNENLCPSISLCYSVFKNEYS